MTPTVLHHMIMSSLLPIEAERQASAAAGSRSGAEAVGSQLQANVKYLDTIFCIKFARYLVRLILLLNAFTPDAL